MSNEYKEVVSLLNKLNKRLDYLIENLNKEDEMLFDFGEVPADNPPDFIPEKAALKDKDISNENESANAVDSGSIKPCVNRYIYIWLKNGRSFWAYLVYVGNRNALGFRWNGKRWVPFGISLQQIDSFICY